MCKYAFFQYIFFMRDIFDSNQTNKNTPSRYDKININIHKYPGLGLGANIEKAPDWPASCQIFCCRNVQICFFQYIFSLGTYLIPIRQTKTRLAGMIRYDFNLSAHTFCLFEFHLINPQPFFLSIYMKRPIHEFTFRCIIIKSYGFCTHIYVNIALCNFTHFTIFSSSTVYVHNLSNQYLIKR